MSEVVACPWCNADNHFTLTAGKTEDVRTRQCATCGTHFVFVHRIITTEETSVHKIEGIEPSVEKQRTGCFIELVDSKHKLLEIPTMEEIQKDINENTYTCYPCGTQFTVADGKEPKRIQGEIFCPQCVAKHKETPCSHGTQPDPEQFHCSHCGTLHLKTNGTVSADGGNICKSCFEEELAEREQNAPEAEQMPVPDEQNTPADEQSESEYTYLPDSNTVSYCIDADGVNLKYKGSFSGRYTHDLLWTIIDLPANEWSGEIHSITETEPNHVAKASALNQFCKAVAAGTVKIPGSDE